MDWQCRCTTREHQHPNNNRCPKPASSADGYCQECHDRIAKAGSSVQEATQAKLGDIESGAEDCCAEDGMMETTSSRATLVESKGQALPPLKWYETAAQSKVPKIRGEMKQEAVAHEDLSPLGPL